MNTFLTTILALSGLGELFVGAWSLLVPRSFASVVLGSEPTDPGMRILIFVVGLAAIGLAALHATAIRWLRAEKPEGFHLSIALGGAILLLGVASYGFVRLEGLRFQASFLSLQSSISLLFIDGVRGAILGIVGIMAMNAPATVKELRLPSRSSRPVTRRRRETARTGREPRRVRSREDDRPRGRDAERRRRPAARDGAARTTRSRREGGAGRAAPVERERRERRRERPVSTTRGESVSPREGSDSVRVRRVAARENGVAEGREQRRRSRPPVASETDDARSLGVVVTGRPAVRPASGPVEETRTARPEPERSAEPEKAQRPKAPMVPRLRSDAPARSRRSDGGPAETEHEGENGTDDRRRRRRRRRSPVKEAVERRPVVSTSDEPFDEGDRPRRSRVEREAEPSGNRFIEQGGRQERTSREAPPRETEGGRTGSRNASAPSGEPPLHAEPIDRISVFSSSSTGDDTAAPSETVSTFGHHRRPFLPHRKGRQVKPREQKVHQVLGGDVPRDEEPPQEAPPSEPPKRIALEGKIGMADGIGPVDLDEGPSTEEER